MHQASAKFSLTPLNPFKPPHVSQHHHLKCWCVVPATSELAVYIFKVLDSTGDLSCIFSNRRILRMVLIFLPLERFLVPEAGGTASVGLQPISHLHLWSRPARSLEWWCWASSGPRSTSASSLSHPGRHTWPLSSVRWRWACVAGDENGVGAGSSNSYHLDTPPLPAHGTLKPLMAAPWHLCAEAIGMPVQNCHPGLTEYVRLKV